MTEAPAPRGLTRAAIAALPKVELHCHLDGAARPATLLALAEQAAVTLPASTPETLAPHVQVGRGCRSLREFLERFEVFYPVLRVPGALERLGYELVEDARAAGVVHLEARFMPHLQATPTHDAAAVVRDALAGLRAGAADFGVDVGAILCCYRPLPPETSAEVVRLAERHAHEGVVGVDLAGPEDEPAAPHASALAAARAAGLGVTVHAGEAAGPESVREAVEVLGASRVGHGVAAAEDPALLDEIRARRVTLECCLTSNLHTAAVATIVDHPFERFRRAGLRVTLNTDDPGVSDVTLVDEWALAARTWGLGVEAFAALTRDAVEAAFVDEATRARLRERVDTGFADAGATPD